MLQDGKIKHIEFLFRTSYLRKGLLPRDRKMFGAMHLLFYYSFFYWGDGVWREMLHVTGGERQGEREREREQVHVEKMDRMRRGHVEGGCTGGG